MESFKFIIILFIFLISSLSYAQNMITGSTTLGTEITLIPEYSVSVSDIVGRKKVGFGLITLDGKKNKIKVDVGTIASELDLDTGGGNLTANLRIVKIIVASEGYNSRHWIGIEGSIGPYSVRLELDFEPGMSAITGSTARDVTETPYTLRLINKTNDKEIGLSGTSHKIGWLD
ncbi:MAG: hypothetical protein ISS80_02730 [Candidatus Cloacimonetes bacterium]|nr:hypothetical protein [Candidatus Cloacimonadota bacterium]